MQKDILYTATQLAKRLFSAANAYEISLLSGALEEVAKGRLEGGFSTLQNNADTARELRELAQQKPVHVVLAGKVRATQFMCEWTLPTFQKEAAGFRLLRAST